MLTIIIKITALLEIIQGLICLAPIVLLAKQNALIANITLVIFLIAIASLFIGAGVLLLRKSRMGINISFFIQFFQLLVITTQTWKYKLLLGPGFSFPLGTIKSLFIEVNIVPLIFCIVIALYSNKLRQRRSIFS